MLYRQWGECGILVSLWNEIEPGSFDHRKAFLVIKADHFSLNFMQYDSLLMKNIFVFGCFSPFYLTPPHKDALKLEILHIGPSNLHKRYMARKVSLIVIWPSFEY